MSFILDALRKAEHRRRERDLPTLAQADVAPEDVPGAPVEAGKIVFYSIGAALLAGAGVVFALKGNEKSADNVPLALPPPSSVNLASQDYTDVANAPPSRPAVKVSNARALDREPERGSPQPRRVSQNITAPAQQASSDTEPQNAITIAPSTRTVRIRPQQNSPSTAGLPEYQSVAASGNVSLPPLHVDMHVYSARPEKRFAIINLNKYREGDTMDDGGRVDAITPDGIVINHNGLRFLLRPN